MGIDPKNLAATAELTFSDEFNNFSTWTGSSGTWLTSYWYHDLKGAGGSLPTNGEKQWYINTNHTPTSAANPFSSSNGVLTITAQPADDWIKPLINDYSYTSGQINSYHSFYQKYGYFEISAKLPAGQGLWPAFWLLQKDGDWPPEIDVFEVLGHDMTTLHNAMHTEETGKHTSKGEETTVPDMSKGFHTYGVDWQADKITYYFDGKQVFQVDTPADMHEPMYLIANLAVGGHWPGDPDSSTPFPAKLEIDYIRAYSAASPASDNQPAPAPEPVPVPANPHADYQKHGGDGNDRIVGTSGFDDLHGRIGNDDVSGGDGDDWVVGGKGDDYLSGGNGDDIVWGNIGSDTNYGGAGPDQIRGGQDDDLLVGGAGDDWMSGDRGNDTLAGDEGTDIFHVFPGAGLDKVVDFRIWEGDRVNVLPGASYETYQSGSDVVVDLGGEDRLVLADVRLSTLGSDWIFS